VSETLQLEEQVQLPDAPKLLVEWSSPWREFVSSIGPALQRSQARLAGEAPYGIFPYRGMIPSLLLEAFLIFAAIEVPMKIRQMRPYIATALPSHEVIYYTGDELPRTEDLAGAEDGDKGRAGGDEVRHRTQTIKIARGRSITPQVVDAPNLKLPSSRDAVANLLAIKPDPGPPPAEGLRSARKPLRFEAPVVAPAPEVIHDYTRNGLQLDAVIAPAPKIGRDPFRAAPNLRSTVVPPAPSVSDDHTLVAPALGSAVIAPAPKVSRDAWQHVPAMRTSVVAPAPSVTEDRARTAPALSASVIPPAPGGVIRDISSAPVRTASVAVVPPPVSAPERAGQRNPKLALPAPAVIAPPPSSDISPEMRRAAAGSVPDPTRSVVAPPPTVQSAGTSFVSSLIGKLFGASEAVPPPPSVHSGVNEKSPTTLASNVVPPPPSVQDSAAGGNPRGQRKGMGASLGSNVIAPPPTDGIPGGTGIRPRSASTAPMLGRSSVVPPPPTIPGPHDGTGETSAGKGAPGGTLLANNVVPPPPSFGGGTSASGSGMGRKNPGLGSATDVGAPIAPPSHAGSGINAGAVISSQPGSKLGLPANGGKGALALSPAGGEKAGIGGEGGGSGIARGTGKGSGMSGENSGTGNKGPGRGSDGAARGGISVGNGPGGTGNASSGTPSVPGVSVQGGSSVVTLPSFGSDPSANDPSDPGRSSFRRRQALGVTVVATATSGGAFEPYKNQLHGETYTTYLETSLGTVVVEFSDGTSGARGSLTAPQSVRVDLPEGLPRARMVVACTLDASGNVRNLRVLEAGPAQMTAKIIAALRSWKLQPAMRGDQPVEVTAILGFGINTDDRF
jgi:hypothetical protein